jgi:trk system potassium uptake protein TrkH
MIRKIHLSPFMLPILFFGMVIASGALLLNSEWSVGHRSISWIDALFTATSATCVTGLIVVDTGTFFTPFGQAVILGLIQLGGLGIMTYTSLVFYLWRRRVSLTDRIAVGQSLLHDPTFKLGNFLIQLVLWTLIIEAAGAALLVLLTTGKIPPYSAVFHSISAFCNAGFSIYPDSFNAWRSHWAVNLVIILLVVLGGIGFSVLMELRRYVRHRLPFLFSKAGSRAPARLSWYSRVVMKTSLFLIVVGALVIYLAEFTGYHQDLPTGEAVLSALFQSVTCRTAGFNTLDIGRMTNVSLSLMIILMFIGGAAGSCAGGVKISTFRTVVSFMWAQILGRRQTVVGRYAMDESTLNKALSLTFFAGVIIFAATLLLNLTEGGDMPHPQVRGLYLDLLFEVTSAFGTVGLSTGVTPHLSSAGKCIITLVMFIGRLGPILFLSALQSLQEKKRFSWPEESMLIG